MRDLFPRPARLPLWQRAGLWQGLSLAGFAAAGVMGFLLVTQPDAPARFWWARSRLRATACAFWRFTTGPTDRCG